MGELTIEQKAKLYDEVVNKLKGFMAQGVDPLITRADVQDFFPELAESEDDRIRKEIIEYLKGEMDAFPRERDDYQRWLAWLEKQGEPKEINPSEFDSQLNRLLGQFKSLPKEELASSLSFYLNVVQNDGTYKEEKQGEQKSTNSKEDDVRRVSTIQVLEYAKSLPDYNQFGKDAICKNIAWLEKQGGITKLSEEKQNRFAKGVLTSCALSFINYLDAHKYEGKMCVSNGECEDIENAFHNAMWDKLHRYYCKYIEKQGEKPQGKSALEAVKEEKVDNQNCVKPVDKVEPKFKVGDIIERKHNSDINKFGHFTITDIFENCYWYNDAIICDISEQDEWEISKFKTNFDFKVGQWIVATGKCIYCITKIDGFNVTLVDVDNNEYVFDVSSLNDTRLWTIQDAKDGDVLSYRDGQWIYIYKEKIDDSSFDYHILYSTMYQDLTINDSGFTLLSDEIIPATKEQRDTLMKAMADKGYTFDFEKKELKKIGQKPTWSEDDERLFQIIIDILDKEEHKGHLSHTDLIACVRKLKSLKDRAQPQPKQEWSEEDKDMCYKTIAIINRLCAEGKDYVWSIKTLKKLFYWLKSLKDRVQPQTTWKPSEHQIKSLQAAINIVGDLTLTGTDLKELLEQLNKLRE